jgi:hypothetical protein
MRFVTWQAVFLLLIVQILTGCGGGGGSAPDPSPTKKTVEVTFRSQSADAALMAGFDLDVTFPPGTILATDASGIPLSSAVVLTGVTGGFGNANPQSVIKYDSNLYKLTAHYATAGEYKIDSYLLTIRLTVPASYTPNVSDLLYSLIVYDLSGKRLTVVTTPTFTEVP